MAYFTSYYTTYFDVQVATEVAVPRSRGSGYGPSREEWLAWLTKVNAAQLQVMAERRADRENLRALILEQIRPPDEVKKKSEIRPHSEKNVSPQYYRAVKTPYKPIFQQVEDPIMRRQIAEVAQKIRVLSNKIKRKRRKKKQEETVMTLLFG